VVRRGGLEPPSSAVSGLRSYR